MVWVVVVIAILYRMVEYGYSAKVAFVQRPDGSGETSHVAIWGENLPDRGNSKAWFLS